MNELFSIELAAYTIAMVCIVLGVLFIFQAYNKIIRAGIKEFKGPVSEGAAEKGVPKPNGI